MYLTGVGGDYTVHYSDQDANIWEAGYVQSQLQWATDNNLLCDRLGFHFADFPITGSKMSTYDVVKMRQVLDITGAKNHKAILLLQNSPYGSGVNYCGSPQFKSNWVQVARDFKGDDRIAAFSLFGEPNHISRYDTWYQTLTTPLQFYQEMMSVARAIHVVDSSRKVILPFQMNYYGGWAIAPWIADLKAVGLQNEPNVLIDVDHPYFFENDWDGGRTPEGVVSNHEELFTVPLTEAFGANKCYIGETFHWVGDTISTTNFSSHAATPELQQRFLIAYINMCLKHNISFNLWSFYGSARVEPTKVDVASSEWVNYIPSYDPDKPDINKSGINILLGVLVLLVVSLVHMGGEQ